MRPLLPLQCLLGRHNAQRRPLSAEDQEGVGEDGAHGVFCWGRGGASGAVLRRAASCCLNAKQGIDERRKRAGLCADDDVWFLINMGGGRGVNTRCVSGQQVTTSLVSLSSPVVRR